MAVNPNTTNMAVDKEIAEMVRGAARELSMTALEVTNQLLRFALSQNELEIEVRMVKLKPKSIVKQQSRKKETK